MARRKDTFFERHAVGKVGRKLRGETSPTRGGGGGGKAQTPFEKLAAERGVDLAAEQARAKSQLQSGQRVGGTTASTLELQQQGGRTFQQLADDPFQQGTDISQLTTAATGSPEQSPAILSKIEKIRLASDKPIIGLDGTPIDLNPLSPWDALALVNIPIRNPASLFGREAPGIIATRFAAKTGTGIAVNTVTKRLIKSLATKITGKVFWRTIGGIGLGLWVTEKILDLTYGGKNFGRFEGESEALQTINIARSAAYYSGDAEAYALADAGVKGLIYNETYWDSAESFTPFTNLATGLDKFKDANVVADQVWDLLADDKFNPDNSELSESELDQKRFIERNDMITANQDRQRELDRQDFLFEQEARKSARTAQSKAEKEFMEEQARFWADERAKERALIEEDMLAQAKFWAEYQKEKRRAADANRPSNLNFGLI